MVRSDFIALGNIVPVNYAECLERGVGHDHEPVAEILGNSAVVVRGIAYHHILLRNHLHVRTVLVSVNDEVGGILFRIGEPECGSPLGRSNLCDHVVLGEIYPVVVRGGNLGLVGEPAGALFLVENRAGGHRHKGECAVIIDPWAWLMGLLESPHPRGGVLVGPAVAVAPCLRSPEIHTPWHCHCRVGISGGKLVGRFRADKCADHRNGILNIGLRPLPATGGEEGNAGCNKSQSFEYHYLSSILMKYPPTTERALKPR